MIGVAGVLLIAMIGMVQAGVDPCSAAYNNIRLGVANDDVFNSGLPLTRSGVCAAITNRHNIISGNSAFLGGLHISSSKCTDALSSPQQYTQGRLNKWAGKHCRTLIFGGVATLDDAKWDISTQQPTVYTQEVTFMSTPPPSGFNRVTDGYIYVEGVGADSFQGCYVGYVIALPAMTGGPECMVKVTETDAFIECLRTVTRPSGASVTRRTSAGYFNNYAHYTVKPGSTC